MTIKDIARESGYAVGTVSRVLNDSPDVSDKARQTIMAVVERHGFRINNNAKHMRQQSASGIAIIVKGYDNMLFASIVERLERSIRQRDYACYIYYIDERTDEVEMARSICLERHPMGILFLGSYLEHFKKGFRDFDIPCVLVTNSAQRLALPNLHSVSTDDTVAAHAAIDMLVELGHTRIGIIGGKIGQSQLATTRIEGCKMAISENRLEFDWETMYEPSLISMDDGYDAMNALLDRRPDITAVFAIADVLAIGAIRAAMDRNLDVPGDISVMGFDGIELGEYMTPRLTTVRQSREEIADTSVEMLLSGITKTEETFHEVIPFDLVLGESTTYIKRLEKEKSSMANITFKNVKKIYGNGNVVVPDLNLEIKDKEFIVLVGPSGCGKSTTLRMIAGLEEVSEGDLFIGEKRVNDVPPKDRDIAMVFQSYALYPHMTVYKNMAFALELRKTPKDEIDRKVHEAAKILELEEYLNRKPKQLSGGQRQRVALGRAMVRNPAVFMLDEPLSNLDAKLRTEMRSQIASLHKRLQTTFVYVTHDQTEAMTMGDRIVVMKSGIIQQVDTPQALYNFPCNKFVAGFIGSPQMNFLDATVEKTDAGLVLAFDKYKIPANKSELEAYVGKKVTLGIRPEDIHAEESFLNMSEASVVEADVSMSEMMGSEIYLYLDCAGQRMIARVPSRTGIRTDDHVKLAFDTNKIHVFDVDTEEVICH